MTLVIKRVIYRILPTVDDFKKQSENSYLGHVKSIDGRLDFKTLINIGDRIPSLAYGDSVAHDVGYVNVSFYPRPREIDPNNDEWWHPGLESRCSITINVIKVGEKLKFWARGYGLSHDENIAQVDLSPWEEECHPQIIQHAQDKYLSLERVVAHLSSSVFTDWDKVVDIIGYNPV